MRAVPTAILLLCCVAGCSEDPATPPQTTTSVGGSGGQGGQGGADLGCPPGTVTQDDDSCEPAGTPADQCGDGFEPTGDQSCEPVLPALPCPLGTMAVPGDDTCQPIADCAAGTWGDIAIGPDTQHVDDSYTLGDADGTAQKPWPTIDEAMAAATPGATVAIAEGDYPEALVVEKPLTLWGRCPELVHVGAATTTAVTLGPPAGGATLRGMTVGPAATGIACDGAPAITLRELRIRQPTTNGIRLSDAAGPATATLQRVAIEEVTGTGLRLTGQSEVTADELYTTAAPTVDDSSGIRAMATTTARPNLVLRQATLFGYRQAGIRLAGADGDLALVVLWRNTAEEPGEYGLQVTDYQEQLPSVELRDSMIRGYRRFGIMVRGGEATIERTLFHDGRVYCEPANGADQALGSLSLRQSVVESARAFGLQSWACNVDVAASVVREVAPHTAEEDGGLGVIHANRFLDPGGQGLVEGGSFTMTDSLVSQTHEVGILLVSGTATVSHCHVVDTLPRNGGLFGDGIAALGMIAPGALVVRDSLVQDNVRAGIASFSAQVTVGGTQLTCNAFALAGQSPTPSSPFEFVNEGDNRCGCSGDVEDCKVLTPGLEPPTPPLGD